MPLPSTARLVSDPLDTALVILSLPVPVSSLAVVAFHGTVKTLTDAHGKAAVRQPPVIPQAELLEVRLRELRGIVTGVVIIESPVTFQGRPKPLLLPELRERLDPYWGVITRVVHVPDPGLGSGPQVSRRDVP